MQTVEVTIGNDKLFEIDELFKAMLGLVNTDDVGHVLLQPDVAFVTILDDDSKHDLTYM